MDVTRASTVTVMPTALRRQANQQKGSRNSGRTYQLRMLWWRSHAQDTSSVSHSFTSTSPVGSDACEPSPSARPGAAGQPGTPLGTTLCVGREVGWEVGTGAGTGPGRAVHGEP